jgi:hypothetical protein
MFIGESFSTIHNRASKKPIALPAESTHETFEIVFIRQMGQENTEVPAQV